MPPLSDDSREISFKIRTEYQKNDRLLWTFQEVCENAYIRIVREGKCRDMTFHISLDHPLETMILEKDNKLDKDISPQTGKISEDNYDCSIEISRSILPSQGFAISWFPNEDKLREFSADEKARILHEHREKAKQDFELLMNDAERKGRDEERVNVARNLIEMDISIEQIEKATDLNRDEVEHLRASLSNKK